MLLFGVFVVVIGFMVIVFMLCIVRLNVCIINILCWESILIDLLGVLLVVLVFMFIVVEFSGGNEWLVVVLVFSKIILIGILLGCGVGYLCGWLLCVNVIFGYLYNVFILIFVFVVFVFFDILEYEFGLLVVIIMGIWIVNMWGVDIENIFDFKESLSILLIFGLFILFVVCVDLEGLIDLSW